VSAHEEGVRQGDTIGIAVESGYADAHFRPAVVVMQFTPADRPIAIVSMLRECSPRRVSEVNFGGRAVSGEQSDERR
jgi:hypothetical protein